MKISIFLFDGVTALGAIGPYESLARLPGAQIVFVGKAVGPVRTGDGFLGLRAGADIAMERDADILIVPGGHRWGLTSAIADEGVLSDTRRGREEPLDMLRLRRVAHLGRRGRPGGEGAATQWRAQEALARFGAQYAEARVSTDGKYMTSAGVSAGIDTGLILCAELAGQDVAEAVQLSIQYDRQPPFDAGSRFVENARDSRKTGIHFFAARSKAGAYRRESLATVKVALFKASLIAAQAQTVPVALGAVTS